MGDANELGFGSVLWGQRILALYSREFFPLYQGRSSKFREGDNLTMTIEQSFSSGELQSVELFILTKNMVFESVYKNGTSKIPLLFGIVLRLHQVKMKGDLILYVTHIAGKRMI